MTYMPFPGPRPFAPVSKRPSFKLFCLTLILSLTLGQMAEFLVQQNRELISATSLLAPKINLKDLPIIFEPNVGQTDSSVRFQAQGLGGMISFTPNQIVLNLPSAVKQDRSAAQAAAPASATVVRLNFVGANSAPQVESVEQLSGVVNYFFGDDPSKWHTGVPTYGALQYKELYPGIDLRYDGKGGRLKGTYFVAAGADPTKIRWRYDGSTAVTVDESGNLVATLPVGKAGSAPTLVEEAPIAWQTLDRQQVPVDVSYTIGADNTIGFAVGAYDPSLPLVLDPTLSYTKYIGGSNEDIAHSIAIDEVTGEIYITGETLSGATPFPTNSPHDSIHNGGKDVFVRSMKADGTQGDYSTYLGGAENDRGLSIAVDSSGNAYITGETASSGFPRQYFQEQNSNYTCPTNKVVDMFVTKLESDGDLAYSSCIGGDQADVGWGITVDGNNIPYIVGSTRSSGLEVPSALPDKAGPDTTDDAFIAKLNLPSRTSDLSIVYGTYLGGSSGDIGFSIALDPAKDIYVAGTTTSSDFPKTVSTNPVRGLDTFVAKLRIGGTSTSPVGNWLYKTYVGGSGLDESHSIAVDSRGHAYIAGWTSSDDLTTTQNAYAKTLTIPEGQDSAPPSDAFVMQLDANANVVYSSYFGGTDADRALDIAVDKLGYVYITGDTVTTASPPPTTPTPVTETPPPNETPGATETPPPDETPGATETPPPDETATSTGLMALSASELATVNSIALPTTADAVSRTHQGRTDAFVAQFNTAPSLNTSVLLYGTYLGSDQIDIGRSITLDGNLNIHVAGQAGGTLTSTTGSTRGTDAFVAKITSPVLNRARIFIDPSSTTDISVGQVFAVTLQVDTKDLLVDEIYTRFEFDDTKLQVVNEQGAPVNEIQPILTAFDQVTTKSVSQSQLLPGNGTITFAANRTQAPAIGTFPIATIRFRALQHIDTATPTQIPITNPSEADRQLFFRESAMKPSFGVATISTLRNIRLNGRLALDHGLNWTTTLTDPANEGIAVYTRSTPPQKKSSVNGVATQANGQFSTRLDNITPWGDYDIRVKGENTLSNKRLVNLPSNQEVCFGTLLLGDLTGDDKINGADASYLAPAFGLDSGDTGFRRLADLDKNGSISDPDISKLAGNFLKNGPIPVDPNVTCSTPPATPPATPTAASIAATAEQPTLRVEIPSGSVQAGDIITASLNIDLRTANADTIGSYLDFDPRYLEVIDNMDRPATHLNFNTAMFSGANYNLVDNTHGQVSLSVSRFGQPWLTGTFTIATIRFRAKAPTFTTQITLVQNGKRHSESYSAGNSLHVNRLHANVKINGPLYQIYLPQATP